MENISEVTIGEYHDYIVMNHKETILNPTPEDIDRVLQEGDVSDLPEIEQQEALNVFMAKLNGGHYEN
jgi:hypothetical protein